MGGEGSVQARVYGHAMGPGAFKRQRGPVCALRRLLRAGANVGRRARVASVRPTFRIDKLFWEAMPSLGMSRTA